MRIYFASAMLLLFAGAGAAVAAPAQRQAAARRADPEPVVHDLGRVDPSAPDTSGEKAPDAPSKAPAIAALKTRTNGDISLGATYRVTPRNLYDPHIGVQLSCWAHTEIYTQLNMNSWSCSGGDSNALKFYFRQLEPNASYLMTVSGQLGASVEVETQLNGATHKTTIAPPGDPLFIVFQTGAGQTTANVTVGKIHGSAYGLATAVFRSLELTKIN